MKGNYNINFKYGISWSTELYAMLLSLIVQNSEDDSLLDKINRELEVFNTKATIQLKNFIERESFDPEAPNAQRWHTKLLIDLLPTLCLHRNNEILDILTSLGLKENDLSLFIDKNALDSSIRILVQDLGIHEEFHVPLYIFSYLIAFHKTKMRLEETFGHIVYYGRNKRIKTRSKEISEKIMRAFNEGKELTTDIDDEDLSKKLNSPQSKKIFQTGSALIGRNHDGSYNMQPFAAQLFVICKAGTKEVSVREICNKLYDVFKTLYGEKKLYLTETEYKNAENSMNPEERPIGDNFREYRIKKVISITGPVTSRYDETRSEKLEIPDGDVNLSDLIEMLTSFM